MKPQFVLLSVVHVLIWAFVLFAFFNKKTATINLYYIIPIIYILHIFPIHLINHLKERQYPDDWEDRANKLLDYMIFPGVFVKCQRFLDDYSFANPIGAQGMLIFGALTCAYRLRR